MMLQTYPPFTWLPTFSGKIGLKHNKQLSHNARYPQIETLLKPQSYSKQNVYCFVLVNTLAKVTDQKKQKLHIVHNRYCNIRIMLNFPTLRAHVKFTVKSSYKQCFLELLSFYKNM